MAIEPTWIKKSVLPTLVLSLAACGFDGDVFREFLPEDVANAPSLYYERNILVCAVSIYQVPDESDFAQVPLSQPEHATTDWLQLPLEGRVNPVRSFAAQALFDGDNCFGAEARRITGLNLLSDYFSLTRHGYFVELRHDLVLIHDMELDLIIISSRAR